MDNKAGAAGHKKLTNILLLALISTPLITSLYIDAKTMYGWLHLFSGGGRELITSLFQWRLSILSPLNLVTQRLLLLTIIAFIIPLIYQPSKEALKKTLCPDISGNERLSPPKKTFPLTALLLVVALILGATVATLPYTSPLNPEGKGVGVDYPIYYNALSVMYSSTPYEALGYAMQQDRPFTLILLYLLGLVTSIGADILKLTPLILSFLNIISIYILTYEATLNTKVAAVSSLIEATSIRCVAGIAGGLYANWLSFVTIDLTLALLLRVIRTKRKLPLVLSVICLAMALLIHPWSWFITSIVLAAFLLWSILLLKAGLPKDATQIRAPTLLISSGIAVDLIKYLAFSTKSSVTPFNILAEPSGVLAGITIFQYFHPSNILHLQTALYYSFTLFLGGTLASFPLFLAAMLGELYRTRYLPYSYRLLISWIIVIGVGILFAPIQPREYLFEWTQARLILYLPLSVLASVGLVGTEELLLHLLNFGKGVSTAFKSLLYVAFIVSLLTPTTFCIFIAVPK